VERHDAPRESNGSPMPESGAGNGPAMSWTQPARQGTAQAQLFEPPVPQPAQDAPRPSPQQAAPPPPPAPAQAQPAAPSEPKQVVWSSAPTSTEPWHGESGRDE
jgi:hypothetical protein